ncbi:ABC transporter substrate-binding protein [Anaerolineales bacterium HSG25]|nr:ABC transporter substrate-binding protein [Anaerolineales bacterium HSG25]
MSQKPKQRSKAQRTKSVSEALLMMGRSEAKTDISRMALFEGSSVFLIALICCFLFLGLTLYLNSQYNKYKAQQETIAFEDAHRDAFRVALSINRELNETMLLARGIANDLTHKKLSNEELVSRITSDVDKKPNIFGLGAAFEPREYKSDKDLFAPYYSKNELGEFKRGQIENFYDYTDSELPQSAWYSSISQGGGWIEPYFGEVAQTYLAEYTIPFYRLNPDTFENMPIGLIYVDHSLETLTEFVKSLDLGEGGYSYILSKEGKFISHPDKGYLERTIFEIADETGNEALRRDGERALAGKIFYREEVDPETGQENWIFYEPVPIAGWSIGVVFNKDIRLLDPNTNKRSLIQIILSGTGFLLFLSVLLFRAYNGGVYNLWAVSFFTAILFITAIGCIWYLEMAYPPYNHLETVLADSSTLKKHLAIIDNRLRNGNEGGETIEIPTGVMLETIGFENTIESSVSGYIWQKYPQDLPEAAKEMPLLTDSVDDEGAHIDEIYRFTEGDTETVGWFFRATLRQKPSVHKYPLDQATVQLQIWPRLLDKNFVLIPDLDSYEFIEPIKQPGLVENLVIQDWYILRSYFSYRTDKYSTDFGGNRTIKKHYIPDLYYNVVISRSILSPIIAHAVTILVVISLMFAVLLVQAENSFNVLSYAAALFFVVAVSHVGLRSELQASGVVYLEYAYISAYVILLIISVNSMLFYSNINISFIQFGNNLYPKLLYWPVVIGAFLAVTLIIFYPAPPDLATIRAKNDAIEKEYQEYLLKNKQINNGDSEETVNPEVDGLESNEDEDIEFNPEGLFEEEASDEETSIEETGEETEETLEEPTVEVTVDEETPITEIESVIIGDIEAAKVITGGLVTLRYNLPEAIQTLDPSFIERAEDDAQIRNLFVGLTQSDPQGGQVVPALATDWESSEDGLEWTFKLRNDIVWIKYDSQTAQVTQATDFDGNPKFVNAHDVVYTIQRVLSSENPTASMLYIIENAQAVHAQELDMTELGVEAIDAWTVKFKLKHPAVYFPAILSHPRTYPVPSWAISEWADGWTNVEAINTSGPYLLSQWNEGKQVQFIKNPLWIEAEQVQIEQINQTVVTDTATALAMYQDNEFDTLSDLIDEIENIQNNTQFIQELSINYTSCSDYLGFVYPQAPFDDVRIRQAFSAAIDRQGIVNESLGDTPATTFAPQGIFGAPSPGRYGQSYEPEMAKTILQEYLDDLSLTTDEFNVIYDIVLDKDNETTQKIQQMWYQTLGITVTLKNIGGDYNHSVSIEEMPHIFYATHCATYPDENNFVHEVFNSQQGTNYVRRNCNDPACQEILGPTEFDKLTTVAAETADPRERFELYAQAEQILAVDEAAYAPLSHPGSVALTKPWLYRNYPADKRLDFYNWSIDIETQE